jgi:hypothetical protein
MAKKPDIKRYPLNMRTTNEVREKLERAAAESGRSLAQEVEFRLERSFEREALGAEIRQDLRDYALTILQDEAHRARPDLRDQPSLRFLEVAAIKQSPKKVRANPGVAARVARDTYRKAAAQSEDLAGDAQAPEAMRALAEKNIARTRQIYERSKDALDAILEGWERSFDAVGQGDVALNRKIIEVAQRNINANDFYKKLAAARNLAELMDVHASFWRNQIGDLQSQAEEVRVLTSQVAAEEAKPIKGGAGAKKGH